MHSQQTMERPSRTRSVLAIVLGVLAVVLVMVATVAVWARVTAFDSEKVADIAGAALEEPEVSAALAAAVTDRVMAAVDLEATIEPVLPDRVQPLAPLLASGARSAVERGVDRLLANPDVQAVMTEVVERAHRRAMQLLTADGLVDGVTVVDGAVTVNLLPLVGRGLGRLQAIGLLEEVDVPDLSADGDPADQIASLEAAVGRDLPDDFGQLVVYQSDRLAERHASLEAAQRIVVLAKRAVWLLAGLAVVALGATVLVARDRWRAALLLGLGVLAAMVVVRAAVQRVVDEAPDVAATPGGRAAIDAMVGAASRGLLRLSAVLLLIGAVVALLVLFRRRWQHSDLVAVAATLAFVLVVAVAGLTLLTLTIAVVIALLVPVAARRLLSDRPPDLAMGTSPAPEIVP